jgi:hypothetical protein
MHGERTDHREKLKEDLWDILILKIISIREKHEEYILKEHWDL